VNIPPIKPGVTQSRDTKFRLYSTIQNLPLLDGAGCLLLKETDSAKPILEQKHPKQNSDVSSLKP
jgi:hypothetical protein